MEAKQLISPEYDVIKQEYRRMLAEFRSTNRVIDATPFQQDVIRHFFNYLSNPVNYPKGCVLIEYPPTMTDVVIGEAIETCAIAIRQYFDDKLIDIRYDYYSAARKLSAARKPQVKVIYVIL